MDGASNPFMGQHWRPAANRGYHQVESRGHRTRKTSRALSVARVAGGWRLLGLDRPVGACRIAGMVPLPSSCMEEHLATQHLTKVLKSE